MFNILNGLSFFHRFNSTRKSEAIENIPHSSWIEEACWYIFDTVYSCFGSSWRSKTTVSVATVCRNILKLAF